MSGRLYIAEKPDIAEKLSAVLGGVILSNGQELKFEHLGKPAYSRLIEEAHKSKGYFETRNGDIIAYAKGHLFEMRKPKDYVPDLKWIPEHFPVLPTEMMSLSIAKMYKKVEFKKNLVDVVIGLMKKASVIVNCMDADREGQCIFMIPFIISGSKAKVLRMWTNDQTEKAIRKSLDNLEPNDKYMNLWYAGISRAVADWYVGMNITGVHVAQTANMVHIGRVKSPTLAIIVQRDREIDNFKKEKFFTLVSDYGTYKGELDLESLGLSKITDYARAVRLRDELSVHRFGTVLEYETSEERKPSPQLFDFTELASEAGDKFHFKMDETLSYIQGLYDKGFVSYPRSDCRYLPSSLEDTLEEIMENLLEVQDLQRFRRPYKKPGSRFINDAKQSESSHYAIIPTTTKPDFSMMTDNEKKIYNLIALRFLAMFYEDVIIDKTKVIVQIGDAEFVTNGKQTRQIGWAELYDIDLKNVIVPKLTKGDQVSLVSINLEERETKPPKPYTTRTLGAVMANVHRLVDDKDSKDILKEVEGIGTVATRSSIVKELEDKGYITQKNNTIRSTDHGKNAVGCLEKTGIDVLYSPMLTARWEMELKRIEKGASNHNDFINGIVDFVNESTNTIKRMPKAQRSFPSTSSSNSPAPSASKSRSSSNGSSSKTVANSTGAGKGKAKKGECGFCREGEIKVSSHYYHCSKCGVKVWKNAFENRGGHTVSEDEAKKLLANQSITRSFNAKASGNGYTVTIKLKPDGKYDTDLVKKR